MQPDCPHPGCDSGQREIRGSGGWNRVAALLPLASGPQDRPREVATDTACQHHRVHRAWPHTDHPPGHTQTLHGPHAGILNAWHHVKEAVTEVMCHMIPFV